MVTTSRPVSDDPGFPTAEPAPEPRVGPMAAHAAAMQVIAGLLVDVDDEIAQVIANALDIMGSSMVAIIEQRTARESTDVSRINNDLADRLSLDAACRPGDAAVEAMKRGTT
jgi:hypothetical protein